MNLLVTNLHSPQAYIAGTGRSEAGLRRLAADCTNIEFRGLLEQSELRSLYGQAVAVIVPSLCYEVFPLVMLEAFREKTPVLARKLGGMAEVIEDSGGGVSYESDNELISGMNRLLEDAAHRRELGARGYRAFYQSWTLDAGSPSRPLLRANKQSPSRSEQVLDNSVNNPSGCEERHLN